MNSLGTDVSRCTRRTLTASGFLTPKQTNRSLVTVVHSDLLDWKKTTPVDVSDRTPRWYRFKNVPCPWCAPATYLRKQLQQQRDSGVNIQIQIQDTVSCLQHFSKLPALYIFFWGPYLYFIWPLTWIKNTLWYPCRKLYMLQFLLLAQKIWHFRYIK